MTPGHDIGRAPVAIPTGSDSGIGRATAVRLAEAGGDTGITWPSDRSGAEDTVDEVRAYGRKAAVGHLDLTACPARSAG